MCAVDIGLDLSVFPENVALRGLVVIPTALNLGLFDDGVLRAVSGRVRFTDPELGKPLSV